MTLPLITNAALELLGACLLRTAFMSHPACPPRPVQLDEALALLDEHRDAAEFVGFNSTSIVPGAARWLTAKLLLQHGDWLAWDALKRLNYPRLGIFATQCENHQTALCTAETLTLVSAQPGRQQVGLFMFPGAHAQIHSEVEVVVTADESLHPDARSVAALHPGCVVSLDPSAADNVATWHALSRNWWRACDLMVTQVPY